MMVIQNAQVKILPLSPFTSWYNSFLQGAMNLFLSPFNYICCGDTLVCDKVKNYIAILNYSVSNTHAHTHTHTHACTTTSQ
jgi:hypothetical protein